MTHPGPVSVVIPTYRRPEYLRRCLQAVITQSIRPDEVVVVRRPDDQGAITVLHEYHDQCIRPVIVTKPGMLAALHVGIRHAAGRIIAFTDDDAVPFADWLESLLCHFRDASVGAVGGRDIVHNPDDAARPLTGDVGRIDHWGKLVGNHHLGTGPPRDVMVLKAVNMAFRREALAIPAHLRGWGAQVHFEVATSLWARRQGWRLIYDPGARVDHYVGPRFDADQRWRPRASAVRDAAYNLVFSMLAMEPDLYWRRAAYGLGVGDRAHPGVARAVVAALHGEPEVIRRVVPSIIGQIEALVDIARGRRHVFVSAAVPRSSESFAAPVALVLPS
jgi:glycosyltransferase involved in cell wall biosynthesis